MRQTLTLTLFRPHRTPAGVGWSSEPRITLKDGDEFRVFVSHGVGTLINKIVEEQ